MALKIGEEEAERLPAPIGDNSQSAGLSELLRDRYAKIFRQGRALLDRLGLLPPEIVDDKTHAPYADLAKEIDGVLKRLEALRVNEKEPWLVGTRSVDNTFKAVSDPLEAAYNELGSRIGEYLEAKKEAEQARLRALKARADEALRAAVEAARKKEAEAKAAMDAAAKKLAAKSEVSIAAAKRRVSAAMPTAVARRIEAAGAARFDVAQAERSVDRVISRQQGPAAELARTRSTQAVSTLLEEWDFEIIDIKKIPIEELRPYFLTEAFEKAIRGFMKTGRRELKGVRFFKKSKGQIR